MRDDPQDKPPIHEEHDPMSEAPQTDPTVDTATSPLDQLHRFLHSHVHATTHDGIVVIENGPDRDMFEHHPDSGGLTGKPITADVHFFKVLVSTGTMAKRQEFMAILIAALEGNGAFGDLTVEQLQNGPNYIALGGWIGDQQPALKLIALGDIYGWWKAITPAVFSFSGSEADSMAGRGFVFPGEFTDLWASDKAEVAA